MSEIKNDLHYTKDHEWIRKAAQSNTIQVGITDFAQESLGDVTYVQLPEVGKSFKKGEVFGNVESVKSVSDLYAPVSGKITKINEALNDDPAAINSQPYGEGWMVEIEVSNEAELSELLSPEDYKQHAQ